MDISVTVSFGFTDCKNPMDELFVSIVEADNKFSRNISVGQIVVEDRTERLLRKYM